MGQPSKRAPFSISYSSTADVVGYTLVAAPGAGKAIVVERVETAVLVLGGSGNIGVQYYYEVVSAGGADWPLICQHGVNQIHQHNVSDFTGLTTPFFGAPVRQHRQNLVGVAGVDAGLVSRGSVENKPIKLTTIGANATMYVFVTMYGHILTLAT